ncbi:MAG: LysR family transcriptional regulator [Novosphingobium pentaromativorans]|uniref:LysR family transcriptional regulator n=1 Tax=Novosphingobium pentaromativorans TaxID=205844 RepID=A0A2W5QYN0_9SPHN|nr:LysR family transcriptional regulator [Novosphingobium panipatense]PZQ56500.1 MAG: LysR family transcriptional regulator [Novosphingobium pentaromativorans]
MPRTSLAELEAFATVARQGGFRAAARELGVSSSGLSHAIAALEARMNLRLFNRTTRSVVLTAAGEQFLEDIIPALAAIDGAIENAGERQGEPMGVLRLNMAAGAARFVMAPLIRDYLDRYPRMEVEIVSEAALVDVIGKGFDAGVRLLDAVPPDMIAVPIIPQVRLAVVGSPAYLQDRPIPIVPRDLLAHECIRYRLGSGRIYRWEFERGDERLELEVPGRLTLDDSGLMLDAALKGMGLGYLAEETVAPHVRDGQLVQLMAGWMPREEPPLCLYYPGRRHVPAKLRAFIDLIRSRAG